MEMPAAPPPPLALLRSSFLFVFTFLLLLSWCSLASARTAVSSPVPSSLAATSVPAAAAANGTSSSPAAPAPPPVESSPAGAQELVLTGSAMSTSRIVKPKPVKASWDAVAHRVFLDVCIEEINANNRPVQVLTKHGYENLVTKFNERTKRNYDKKQMKNRWETLKKDYTVWKGLLQHASGLGIDPVTHTIDASDDWWAHEIQMCPEASKFRIAPLQDEEDLKILFDKNVVTNVAAMVPPSSQARGSGSRIDTDEHIEGSGSGGEEPIVAPLRTHGKKKRGCPYSSIATPKMSTTTSNASRFDRMMELMEKREREKERIRKMEEDKSKNSVTSPDKSKESSRDEIRRLVALVYQDGAEPGSLEYFYATQIFLLPPYREVFACLVEDATPAQRIQWLRMTWEHHSKK